MAQATAHRAVRPPVRRPILLRIAQVLYGILVGLSVLVVGLFLTYKLLARAPEIVQPEPIVVMSTVVADDPDTLDDETQVTETTITLTRRAGVHTFLLIGEDDGNGNADTIIAVTYDIPRQQVGVVSIPRDTLVDVKRTVKKINAAFGQGGVEQVREEASALLGIPIDHTIQVNLRAFRAIVDAVGGIDFYIPVDMHYEDPTQNLSIHYNKGMTHLNGAQALDVVRFRSGYGNADLGRIETQQKFLAAMAKKVLSWQNITKISNFIDIFSTYVKTDLTVGNLLHFATSALELDMSGGVSTATLPGDGSVTYLGIPYYYELYPDPALEMINTHLNPYTTPVTREMASIFQAP